MDKLINQIYLAEEQLEAMRQFFRSYGFLKLDNFLSIKTYEELINIFNTMQWKKLREPARFSFSQAILDEKLMRRFDFAALARFLSLFSDIKELDIYLRKYEHRDYTLLNNSLKSKSQIEFLIYFPDGKFNEECGGYKCFVDENGKSLIFPIEKNSLCIVKSSSLTSFTKYLNHKVGDGKLFVLEGKANTS